MKINCTECRKEIRVEEGYRHLSKILCEECCMVARMPRVRKAHWQYLKSIKTEYVNSGRC